jgi:hypothetical protein
MPSVPVTPEMNALAAQLGIATLLFFSLIFVVGALILYIRWQSKKESQQAKESSLTLHKVIDTLREDKESDRRILMGVLEDNRQQIEITRRVVEKISAQDQTLQVLLNKTSNILENRCINHLKSPL